MRKTRMLLVAAVIGVIALLGQPALAGGTGAIGDDYLSNTPAPYVGYNPAAPGPNHGCDTLDPVLAINKNLLAYKCIGFPGAPGMPAENGVANLTSFSMGTSGSNIVVNWTTQGPIPTPGADTIFEGVHGFSFAVYFQNASNQNKRQIVGNTLDCTRYAHMGPYLTGNGEYIGLFYNIVFNDGQWVQEIMWSHFDPVGLFNWAFVADGAMQVRGGCTGTGPSPTLVNWGGTGASASVSGNSVTLTVPQDFYWADNQLNLLHYRFMEPGDLVTNVSAQVSSEVDTATTPPVCVGSICQSQQGVSNQLLLDWAPWGAYDLGTATAQTQAVPGPSCAAFNALEYQPGGGKNGTGGTYLPLTKGPSGQDRETQVNPLFGAPNGLNNYDSSGEPGTTTNDIRPQGHNGPLTCNFKVPLSSGFTGGGGSFTA